MTFNINDKDLFYRKLHGITQFCILLSENCQHQNVSQAGHLPVCHRNR